MAVIASRTREQIRVSVGRNLGSPFRLVEADATGTPGTFVTDELSLGGSNEHLGKWLVFTSGSNNDGSIRRVTGSAIANSRQSLTFFPDVTDATANGDTAELWNEGFNPESIHDFINQAIMDATGHAFSPIENIALHAGGDAVRFDIPANITMIQHLDFRTTHASAEVHPMSRVFDETTDSDFTQTVDTQDFRQGSSLKLTIGAGVSAGDFITDGFTAIDLSKYTHIEGWVKAASTLVAADFVLHLDSGAVQADGTDLESLNVPATTAADTWTFFRIPLAQPEADTAIASIGLEYNANHGANTVWFDEVRAVQNDSAVWARMPRSLWRIDKAARDLLLTSGGRNVAGYSLLKIIGGNSPTLLTADATVNEIDDDYVIKMATAMMLMSQGGGVATDREARMSRGTYWNSLAERARQSFGILQDVRLVE